MAKKKIIIATETAVETKVGSKIVILTILLLGTVIAASIGIASWFAANFIK